MVNAFNAGSVTYEFLADTKPITRSARKLEGQLARHAKVGAARYEREFDGRSLGRRIVGDMARGIRASAPTIKTALLATASVAGIAAGAASGLAVVGKAALRSAADMKVQADAAGLTAERFQELRFAADRYGISGEKLADVQKDVRERIGQLLNEGAGPLQDFLDDIGYKAGLTAESFRNLSGDQAMQLVISTMESMGANGAQLSATFESLASDSTRLIPLYRNQGAELSRLAGEARDAGLVLSDDMAQGAFDANAELDKLGATLRAGVTRAVVENADGIEDLTNRITELIPTLIDWAAAAVGGFADLVGAIDDASDRLGSFARDARTVGAIDALRGSGVGDKSLDQLEKLAAERRKQIFRLQELIKDHREAGTPANENAARILEARIKRERELNETVTARIRILKRLDDPERDTRSIVPGGDPADAFLSSKTRRVPPSSGPRLTGGGVDRDAARAALKAQTEAARERNRVLSDYSRLVEETSTPQEAYAARLGQIAELEASIATQMADADPAAFSRARAQAIVELSQEVGNLNAAYMALADATARGLVNEQDAVTAMTALNATRAEMVAEANEAALEAEAQEREAILAKNDALLEEVERKQYLLELAGNTEEADKLQREIDLLRTKGQLLRGGATEGDATRTATVRVDEEAAARAEGEAKRSFESGVLDAMASLEGPLTELFGRSTSGAITGILDAAGQLFDALSSGGDGGGLGGLVGAIGGLFSFEGGGFTGRGARTGGLDGKGGYLAMVHPDETVIDHRAIGSLARPMPSASAMAGMGEREPVRFEVMPAKGDVFDATVRQVSAPQSAQISQRTVGEAQRSARKRAGRKLSPR